MENLHLKPWQEYIGHLENISYNNGKAFLHFRKDVVVIPIEFAEKLKNKMGKKIAVLRTDIPDKPYLWREEKC